MPGVVALRRVTNVSVISRTAPRAEDTLPLRSRVAAIRGALVGVEMVATIAFSPLTLL